MQITKNKTMTILIATLLVISIGASTVLLPTAIGAVHNPGWQIITHAYIQPMPNPVGAGQTTVIYMWLDYVFQSGSNGSAMTNDWRFHNYKLYITDPDGETTTKTFDVIQDTTSNQAYKFTPDKAGTYILNFTFPGQNVYDYSYNPAHDNANDTYLRSTATYNLTVTEDPIPTLPHSYPLPTEYWTRPIYGENTDWWTISSNWLGVGAPGYGGFAGASYMGGTAQLFPADAIGPLTPHIMWTKPYQAGGVAGGDNYQNDYRGDTFFEGSAYNQRFLNPIIVNGKLYYNTIKGYLSSTFGTTGITGVAAIDLRTGKQLVTSTTITSALSFAYIPAFENPNQHGVVNPILCTANFAAGYDADTLQSVWTGVSGVPTGYSVMGPYGEPLRYVLQNRGTTTVQNWTIGQWNSTKMWGWTGNSPTYPSGNQAATTKYDYIRTISYQGINYTAPSCTTIGAIYDDILIAYNGTLPCTGSNQFINSGAISFTPYTYFAINLNASKGEIGNVLWMKTLNPPEGNLTVLAAGFDPINRVFVENYRETNQWVGYNMDTGAQLWGPTLGQEPMDYYGSPASGSISNNFAFGNLYSSAYAGIVYCYSAKNGTLLWTYGNGGAGNTTDSGFAVPGHYPTFINAVGKDGIIYTVTSEHTIETPAYKGALARALNATTGEEIWTLSSYTGEFNANSYAIADGYAVWFNGLDNQLYSVGKGPTQLTVNAPQTSNELGKSLIISGTLIDTSTGTKQDEQAARFPNGIACASDASMSDWMGYIYQQKPMPANFSGVTVSINVIDANGNYRTIGTAKTDQTGTYRLTWQPDISGTYTVYANFEGTNAYWPSYSETGFVVDEPPATPTPTPQPEKTVADLYLIPLVSGLFVTIIVVGLAIILVLRKRP